MLERMLAALTARAPRTLRRQLRPKREARAIGGEAPHWDAAEEQALAQAAACGEAARRSQYSERLAEMTRQLSDQGFTVAGGAWSPR